jgi:ubiquinone/menaquinone biosynthesis C-methylase UbiE
MSWKYSTVVGCVVGLALLAAGAIAVRFAFFILPFAWTGEPEQLARALGLQRGNVVADIGAGSGALATAMAAQVGETGRVYATELSAERRAAIERRVTDAAIDNLHVITDGETNTGLPDQCCDAVYLRAVIHHIGDRQAFATSLTRTLRAGGRVGVIDFAPGTLWFHGADHGVRAEAVVTAFRSAGLRLRDRDDEWGGGMFLLVFEREP